MPGAKTLDLGIKFLRVLAFPNSASANQSPTAEDITVVYDPLQMPTATLFNASDRQQGRLNISLL